MRKSLSLILVSFLVLSACGSNEENKSESNNERTSQDKENKKDDDKKSDKENNIKDSEKNKESKDESNQVAEKQNIQSKNDNNSQQQLSNNNATTTQGNRPLGGIPPKGMTNEEYNTLEQNMPSVDSVSKEAYNRQLNEQLQKIANENNHSIETPMGTYEPNIQSNTKEQNQNIDLNNMPAGDFSTEGMSEEAKKKINELTRQKDFEGLSQEEYNDRVSEIMNQERNKNL
ncbi:hypothetical protein IR133_03700 [Staphylococcus saprophyticus]|uniref:hypothetical protein n=1 Tax=Staphylococcus xylosus TaxID=1288 RepID=UPI0010747BD1|nr:hypothetical protein [Staphylococcus xylosus]MBF0812812.1 hypothetical protein [Staphylococcus saprophyticus]TFV24436.1 hypothetical protein E4T75_03680 [Staphylococcus saprophyticus]